jgi:hypothetical protein
MVLMISPTFRFMQEGTSALEWAYLLLETNLATPEVQPCFVPNAEGSIAKR